MPRCPSLRENGIDGPTVRLSLGRGAGRRAEHGHRTHRNTSPPFLQLGKCRPRAPGGPRGRSARCGNGLFAQCVRLRSEINRPVIRDTPPQKRLEMSRQRSEAVAPGIAAPQIAPIYYVCTRAPDHTLVFSKTTSLLPAVLISYFSAWFGICVQT